jgi:magnesium transporter
MAVVKHLPFETLFSWIHRLPQPVDRWREALWSPASPSSAIQESIADNCFLYNSGRRRRLTNIAEMTRVVERESSDEFIWVQLDDPSTEQLSHLAGVLELHPLAVEDAVHAHQRPKLEAYEGGLFLVLKTVRYVDHEEVVEVGDVMFFLGRSFVVTVRHGRCDALDNVRDQLEASPDVLRIGPSAVMWASSDRIIDGYEEAISRLAIDIEETEAAVFGTQPTSPTQRIYTLKRETLEFRRAVEPLEAALLPLVEGRLALIDEGTLPYFRDVHDHAVRASTRLSSFDQLLGDVLQANVAQVTLRQNEDMRRITAWAAILAVLTTIAGIYGMNFENMPELGWADGYYICLAVMATVSIGLFSLFRRRGWL